MDLKRASGIIYKRKWIILFSIFVIVGCALLISRLTPARWEAVVRFTSPPISLFLDPSRRPEEGLENRSRKEVSTYIAYIRRPEVLGEAAREAGINARNDRLKEMVELEAIGNSNTFELKVADTEEKRVINFANLISDKFVELHRTLATRQNEEQVKFLRGQLQDHDRKAKVKRRQLAIEQQKYQISSDPATEIQLKQRRMSAAQDNIDIARQRINIAESSLVALKENPNLFLPQLDLPEYTTAPNNTPQPSTDKTPKKNDPITKLEDEIYLLEQHRTALRQKYHDTHPDVVAATQELNEKQNELDKRKAKIPVVSVPKEQPRTAERLKRSIANDKSIIETSTATINKIERELSVLRQGSGPISVLVNEITIMDEQRKDLASRLRSAQNSLDLSQRQNSISVLEYAGGTNPAVNTTSGKTLKLLMLAAISAFMITSLVVILLDSLDNRLKSARDAKLLLPCPVLATIPPPTEDMTPIETARATEFLPQSPQAEGYRFLGQHLLNASNRQFRSVMVVSAKAGQGNTRTISNLAITLAQAGYSVLLVDANLRQPDLHRIFRLPNQFGLTDVLQDITTERLEQAIHPTTIPNLKVIPSGPAYPNPWELFSSQKLHDFAEHLSTQSDYILYDTPSSSTYTDALSLSGVVDAALLCVRAVESLTGSEERIQTMIEQSGVHILGCVLVDTPPSLMGRHLFESKTQQPATATPTPEAQKPQPISGYIASTEASSNAQKVGNGVQQQSPNVDSSATDPWDIVEINPQPMPTVVQASSPITPAQPIPVVSSQPKAEVKVEWNAVPNKTNVAEPEKREPAVQSFTPQPTPAPTEENWKTETPNLIDVAKVEEEKTSELPKKRLSGQTLDELLNTSTVSSASNPIEVKTPIVTPMPPVKVEDKVQQDSLIESYTTPKQTAERVDDADSLFVDASPADTMDTNLVSTYNNTQAEYDTNLSMTEDEMAAANEQLPGSFPKTFGGYNVASVDDYVRKINARIETLLMQIQVETTRADQTKRVMDQMATELDAVRRKMADADKRETAALEARKRVEEQYSILEQQLQKEREQARMQLEKALADSRQETENLLLEERQDADTRISEIRRVTTTQVNEARRIADEANQRINELQLQVERLSGSRSTTATSPVSTVATDTALLSTIKKLEEKQTSMENQFRIEMQRVVDTMRNLSTPAPAAEKPIPPTPATTPQPAPTVVPTPKASPPAPVAAAIPEPKPQEEKPAESGTDWRGKTDWRSSGGWRSAS